MLVRHALLQRQFSVSNFSGARALQAYLTLHCVPPPFSKGGRTASTAYQIKQLLPAEVHKRWHLCLTMTWPRYAKN